MEKAAVFFLALAILGVILFVFPRNKLEGFRCNNPNIQKEQEKLVENVKQSIQDKPVEPALAQSGIGSIEPNPPNPADLPLAIIEQRAKGAPLPYRDPSSEPAKFIRLRGMLEDLKAFLAFQAPSLQDQCDPAIQLPLTTARADTKRIEDMVTVLNRNPGMESRITNRDLRGVQDNLNYLRDELRKLENNGVVTEGFEGKQIPDKTPATLAELNEFDAKVLIEKTRIGASGTTDTVVQARIASLERIHQDISQIISQLQEGVIKSEDVPILKSDLDMALPILGDSSKPLPQQLVNSGLPPYILNLFPSGLSADDTSQLNAFRQILEKYGQKIFSSVVNVGHKILSNEFNNDESSSSRDASLMSMNNSQLSQTGGSMSSESTPPPALEHNLRGLPGTNTNVPEESGFNWKERARTIGKRIAMRGLNPKDFGVIGDTEEVSIHYSWRGYTRMICSRLMNTMDPGLPEYCGCPPYNWNGWAL